ncbi:hypothetical protein [Burkholderia ambifaria]|uniref:hypothetical protein n=1 Tax=Burkholderia ambifaria TaxID=152480 RepID=UPI00158C8DB0|nr:hypothetical protein [Burkholderia ambifaria]
MAEPLPIDATEFANETPVVFDVDAGMPLRAVRLKSDARTIRRERHGEPWWQRHITRRVPRPTNLR